MNHPADILHYIETAKYPVIGVKINVLDNIELFSSCKDISNAMQYFANCGVKLLNFENIFANIDNVTVSSSAIDERIIGRAAFGDSKSEYKSQDDVIVFFLRNKTPKLRNDFSEFCKKNDEWLTSYAIFRSIADHINDHDFAKWPVILRKHSRRPIEIVKQQLDDKILSYKLKQFFANRQLDIIRNIAHDNGICVCGDVNVLCDEKSVEVWSHQKAFYVNDLSVASVFSGLPPSSQYKYGIKYKTVPYRINHLKNTHYELLETIFLRWQDIFDSVFLINGHALFQVWEIARAENEPRFGRWVNTRTDMFFEHFDSLFNRFTYFLDFNEPLFPNNEVIAKRHRLFPIVIDGEPTIHVCENYQLNREILGVASVFCNKKCNVDHSRYRLTAVTESCLKQAKDGKYKLCMIDINELLNVTNQTIDDIAKNDIQCAKTFSVYARRHLVDDVKRDVPTVTQNAALNQSKKQNNLWKRINQKFSRLFKH